MEKGEEKMENRRKRKGEKKENNVVQEEPDIM
jgi:hypothetical protein